MHKGTPLFERLSLAKYWCNEVIVATVMELKDSPPYHIAMMSWRNLIYWWMGQPPNWIHRLVSQLCCSFQQCLGQNAFGSSLILSLVLFDSPLLHLWFSFSPSPSISLFLPLSLSLTLSLSLSLSLSFSGWWMVVTDEEQGYTPASYLEPVDKTYDIAELEVQADEGECSKQRILT